MVVHRQNENGLLFQSNSSVGRVLTVLCKGLLILFTEFKEVFNLLLRPHQTDSLAVRFARSIEKKTEIKHIMRSFH